MPTLDTGITQNAVELLTVLDEDIEHLEKAREQLKQMRESVIKRDESALRQILEQTQAANLAYQQVPRKRARVRAILARQLGLRPEQVTLTELARNLEETMSGQVMQKQKTIAELMEKIKPEQETTMMLLRECARFNSILIRSIFGNGKDSVTYSSSGQSRWEARKGFVNYKM